MSESSGSVPADARLEYFAYTFYERSLAFFWTTLVYELATEVTFELALVGEIDES